jgi:hypothetical protein
LDKAATLVLIGHISQNSQGWLLIESLIAIVRNKVEASVILDKFALSIAFWTLHNYGVLDGMTENGSLSGCSGPQSLLAPNILAAKQKCKKVPQLTHCPDLLKCHHLQAAYL